MDKPLRCGPLYHRLTVKGIKTYFDIDNKIFYYGGKTLDNEAREIINNLNKMSGINGIKIVKAEGKEIEKLI